MDTLRLSGTRAQEVAEESRLHMARSGDQPSHTRTRDGVYFSLPEQPRSMAKTHEVFEFSADFLSHTERRMEFMEYLRLDGHFVLPALRPLSLGRISLLTHRSRSTNMATLFTSLRLLPTSSFHCFGARIHAVHQRKSIYTPFGSYKPC